MRVYENLRIAPFYNLLDSTRGLPDHCGGPAYPDWQQEVASRHCRHDDKPIDLEPPPLSQKPKAISGDHAYLGPVCHHFGHQVADFSMRIVPTIESGFDGKFIFVTRPGQWSSVKETPHFFRDIVEYFNLPEERIVILNEEAAFDRVYVAPQAETIFGSPPDDDHLHALKSHFCTKHSPLEEGRPDRPRLVYVSRSKIFRGAFAGERVIEKFMQECGARIVYPEDEAIDGLLRLYASAEFLVFPEGSALHTLQFLGRQLENVVVIKRGQSANYGANFLGKRCKELTYIDAVIGGISGTKSGRFRETGISVLSPEKLLESMQSSLPINPHLWSHDEFRAGFSETFNQWIAQYFAKTSHSDDAEAIIINEARAAGVVPDAYGMSLLRNKK